MGIGHEVVVATGNRGKLAELERILAAPGLILRPQSEFGVPEVEESGLTFIENALIKARAAARHSGLPAIADDSGLAVAYLGGAPGIHSARYSGGDDEANIDRLLHELAGVPEAQRSACFHCALVYLRHAEDPVPVIAEGRWHGRILQARRGAGGFGYDPVFWVPSEAASAAELGTGVKNRISHRALAGAALRLRLAEP